MYEIKVAVPSKLYGTNKKNTSQYTGLTFIPLNIYTQLQNPVFIFYLFIMALEMVPAVSVSDDLPVTLFPYTIVIFIQMILDYAISFKVNNLDNIQNKMTVSETNIFKYTKLIHLIYKRLSISKMETLTLKQQNH